MGLGSPNRWEGKSPTLVAALSFKEGGRQSSLLSPFLGANMTLTYCNAATWVCLNFKRICEDDDRSFS